MVERLTIFRIKEFQPLFEFTLTHGLLEYQYSSYAPSHSPNRLYDQRAQIIVLC